MYLIFIVWDGAIPKMRHYGVALSDGSFPPVIMGACKEEL